MITILKRQNALKQASLLILPIIMLSGAVQGQDVRTTTATIRGAIITKGPDGQSYNIPGANLKLKGTAHVAETSSNDMGQYEFAGLSAGEYTLEASAQGFKTASKVVTVRAG